MSTIRSLIIFLFLSLILFCSLAFFSAISQVRGDTWTWQDDFIDKNARWDWSYYAGTGYHLLTTVEGYSVAENGITAASNASAYSDCALTYNQAISNATVEARIEFSHNMMQGVAKGSQGIILWDGSFNNFAGFFDCSIETQEGFTGFRAIVASGGTVFANTAITVDQTNWHVYRIELNSSGTFMFLDGVLVVYTAHRPIFSPLTQLNIWVDNAAYSFGGAPTYLDVVEDQKVYVDYVAYYSDYSAVPTGSILINGGAAYATSTGVTLTLSADSDVVQMRFSTDGSTWSAYEGFATSKAFSLSGPDGVKTVYVMFKDAAGLESISYSASITLDTAVPTGSILINGGAAYATSTGVTLTLSADSDVVQMRFSTDGSTWSAYEGFATSKAFSLSGPDGVKTVYVMFKDAAGLESISYSASITLDTAVPTGSILINGGAAYATSTGVTLTLSADSDVVQMRFSTDGSTWSAYEGFATSKAFSLSGPDGVKTVYVMFKDAAGLESISYSASITLDTAVPTGSILINGGAAYATSTGVTLTLSADSDVVQMRFSTDGSTWSAYEGFATSKAFSLSGPDGVKTVYVMFKDAAGLESISYSASITLDTAVPTGSILINGGAAYATSTGVTLTLSADSDVVQMRFSTDGSTWSAYEGFATSKAFSLSGPDGVKTVYVMFKDAAGLESISYSASITLDTAVPTGSILINGGAAYATSTGVTLTLSYSDDGSGVGQIRYSNYGVWDSETWEDPAATKSWTLTSGDGTKTVYYQIKSGAGLTSVTYSDTIILDATAPTGSVVINNGASYTNSTLVTLSLIATDATSGISQVRYSNDGVWDTETWETPLSTKTWALPSGDEAKIVYCQVKDNAGLVTTLNDSITLDMTKPTANAGQNQIVDPGATVNFNAGGSTDNIGIVGYAWNFGDGATATEISATHVYSNSGTYTVSLTVEDAAGNIDTKSVTVTVQAVIPEFPSAALLTAFIMIASALTLSFRRKHKLSKQAIR